jgi:glutamyl-tRNA(Gln) amidotransferase subunit D
MVKAEAGDRVRIRTAKEQIEGVLLESHESGLFLIKLDTGYNIGLTREEVLDIEVLEKPEKKAVEEEKIERKKGKRNIAMIITGGTISSKLDPETGGVKSLASVSELLRFYPEIKEIANLTRVETPFMVFSENMGGGEWRKIAKLTVELLNDTNIDGVIITHGTDFLHYTSSALSFMLRNLNKPVVLTYSQRSTDRASSDAKLNLVCAAKAAVSDIAEVMLVGHGSINDDFCYAFRGTKVRKLHTSRRDAFKSVNDKAIAKIWKDKIEIISDFRKRNNRKVQADACFEDRIALVKYYPGQSPDILEYYKEKGYRGVVVEMAGLGHVNTGKKSWVGKLRKLIKSGFFVVAVPQTVFGRLNPRVYSAGRKISETGVIYAEDMLSETGFVKLGWVLGHKRMTGGRVREMMLKNISGELNKRLEEDFI